MKSEFALSCFALPALCIALGACTNAGGLRASDEYAVMSGMTADEVAALLGRPTSTNRYRSSAGPTWSYEVGSLPGTRVFDVEFDASTRVVSAQERVTLIAN
jgi:hypothetical protein